MFKIYGPVLKNLKLEMYYDELKKLIDALNENCVNLKSLSIVCHVTEKCDHEVTVEDFVSIFNQELLERVRDVHVSRYLKCMFNPKRKALYRSWDVNLIKKTIESVPCPPNKFLFYCDH